MKMNKHFLVSAKRERNILGFKAQECYGFFRTDTFSEEDSAPFAVV